MQQMFRRLQVRSLGGEDELQYSCLENRGIWRATVQGVAKSGTRLKDLARTQRGTRGEEETRFCSGGALEGKTTVGRGEMRSAGERVCARESAPPTDAWESPASG